LFKLLTYLCPMDPLGPKLADRYRNIQFVTCGEVSSIRPRHGVMDMARAKVLER